MKRKQYDTYHRNVGNGTMYPLYCIFRFDHYLYSCQEANMYGYAYIVEYRAIVKSTELGAGSARLVNAEICA